MYFHLALISIVLAFSNITVAEDYKLGAGDTINISVYDEPDLSREARIGKSGMISFPFIDDIQIIGLTKKQVEQTIYEGLLGDYLIDPQVTVSIVSYRPFFIHGQVKRPGGYDFQEDLTLDKAIAIAGGLDIRASKDDWEITRTIDGKLIKIDANIATLIRPDDIIKINQTFF